MGLPSGQVDAEEQRKGANPVNTLLSMSPNMLNLPAYMVTALQESEYDYHIDATSLQESTFCPHCHHGKLEGFGRRETLTRSFSINLGCNNEQSTDFSPS